MKKVKGSGGKLFLIGALGAAIGGLIGFFAAKFMRKRPAPEPVPVTPGIEIESFCCSICTELMTEPVVDPHGHCFCRECIEKWLIQQPTCPMTNLNIQEFELRRCIDLANAIEEYKEKTRR
jgi:hypothetical protein